MIIFVIIMGWAILIHGGLIYLIVKKKEYSLISGFYNRPDEEKEYLIHNGYIEKMGKVFIYTFYLLILAFLLTLFNVPFGAEIGFGLFMIVLLGGIVYIQKYEVPHKRKKYYWITGTVAVGTVLFIGILVGLGYMDNDVNISNEAFEVTGMYGVNWSTDEIETVKLLEELPEIIVRNNGMATSNLLKGKFRLEEPFGHGRLFIHKKNSPYLYVATQNDFVLLNRKDSNKTEALYEQLKELVE